MDAKKLNSYVNPKHYENYNVEVMPIEFVEELPFNLASACKYLFRLGKKDNAEIEIGKINWYLNRALVRNEYVKVPKYLCKLAPNGLDLNIAIIRAIANGKVYIVEELRQDLIKEYVKNVAKVEEPKAKRTLNKSNRLYNLYFNNKYFFKFCDAGMLFSYSPIEEGNEDANEIDIDSLSDDVFEKLNKFLDVSQTPDQDEIVDTFKEIISDLEGEDNEA